MADKNLHFVLKYLNQVFFHMLPGGLKNQVTRFGEAAKAQGTDRSALVRAFVAWYMREQGAELPRRPSAGKR